MQEKTEERTLGRCTTNVIGCRVNARLYAVYWCTVEYTSRTVMPVWWCQINIHYRHTELAKKRTVFRCMSLLHMMTYKIKCLFSSLSWVSSMFYVSPHLHCVQKKHPLLFSCITLRKSDQFEWKFQTKLMKCWF